MLVKITLRGRAAVAIVADCTNVVDCRVAALAVFGTRIDANRAIALQAQIDRRYAPRKELRRHQGQG